MGEAGGRKERLKESKKLKGEEKEVGEMKKHDVSCGCKEKQYKPNCNQEDDDDGDALSQDAVG